MISSYSIAVALWIFAAGSVTNAIHPELVGTWTSKSSKVLTGPGVYDPVNEVLFEPSLTGISYSFTSNNFYEEALFRAIANPTTPACPSAIIQWQHGQVIELNNGSLSLNPISVDGRQLLSEPCVASTSTLTRYNQTELFSKYEVVRDLYNDRLRLNLWQWDGTPVNPMWLVYRPPEILPTITMNPTASATTAVRTNDPTSKIHNKRHGSTAHEARRIPSVDLRPITIIEREIDIQKLVKTPQAFYFGICMVSIGGLLVFFF